jgi:nitrogen fixation protein NifU and related proteins
VPVADASGPRPDGLSKIRGCRAWFASCSRGESLAISAPVDLRDLYQEIILDHSRRPRNHGPCPGETAHAHAENPSCGDEVAVHVRMSPDQRVEAITFTGQGSALSQASASLMTTKIRGKSAPEAAETVREVQTLMTGGKLTEEQLDRLGDVQVLQGAALFPQRVKCVTLAWHALDQILTHKSGDVSTE